MRKKKLIFNTISVLINQITSVVCAFILPRLILKSYGSEVNGLVSSITQFLGIITFLDLGVGAVVQSSLYKPLADKDNDQVSRIISSADKFFKRLAFIILCYVVVLLFVYPLIVNQSFNVVYTDTLIAAMCISYFAQYFFGLKYQLLLIADQKGYVFYIINTLTIIANNIAGVLLIHYGYSIQFVKLATSLFLLVRPLILEVYVRKNYHIDRKIKYNSEPIKQKWNGVAQHIATVVLNSTDTIVLTLFSTLANVSIYNVYYLVINGFNNLIISLTSGFLSLIGNMISRNEKKLLDDFFDAFETLFHFGVTFAFGCIMVLIVPFVQVYTKEIVDINYNVPMFALLITLANMVYCYRLPYNTMIKAAGHYKETQSSAIIEMLINIIVSVFFVSKYGLIGVSVGTLSAMSYKMIYLVWYLKKNILNREVIHFIKHMIVNTVCILLMYCGSKLCTITEYNFWSWILLAIKLGIINFIICLSCNLIFFKNKISNYKLVLKKKF